METKTTKNITVSVEAFYQANHSRPDEDRYVFAYRVLIENRSKHTVQLLRRHWYILDGAGYLREVEGEGVIGEKPVLAPNQRHEYVSWCPLPTDLGKMYGTFQMINLDTQVDFDVQIPVFKLIATFKNN